MTTFFGSAAMVVKKIEKECRDLPVHHMDEPFGF
jgi:hypothetical protein